MEAKITTLRSGGQQNVCRCCLSEGCYKDISTEYFWMGKREVYADMLSDTFDVSISYGQTNGPNSQKRLICEPCITRLRDAWEFKKQVIECERSFMQLFAELDSSTLQDSEAEETEQSVKLEELEEMKVEMLESDFDDDFDPDATIREDDDDYDDLEDHPLKKSSTKVPKKEAADILDHIDTQVTVKRIAPVKAKAPPAKKAKTAKEAKPSVSKKAAPAKPAEKNKGSRKPAKEVGSLETKENEDVEGVAYKPTYNCKICALEYKDLEEAQLHIRSDHIYVLFGANGYHHIEGTKYSCTLCSNKYNSSKDIKKHWETEHTWEKFEVKEGEYRRSAGRYRCATCRDRVSQNKTVIHSLNHQCNNFISIAEKLTDLSVAFKMYDNKFECKLKTCKKIFKTVEEAEDHVDIHRLNYNKWTCKKCGLFFVFETQNVNHMKEVHGKDLNVFRCNACSASYSKMSGLKIHMDTIHRLGPVFKCDQCDYMSFRRINLKEHYRRHDKIAKYPCRYCNKAFTRLKTQVFHERIHTRERLRQCPYCEKKFVQRTSVMYHVRKYHPNEDY